MAISLKHKFNSLKGDGPDATLIRPSNWNDEHALTLAQDKIIGRVSAGTGAAEEITCTPAARTILDDTSIAAILATLGITPPSTGDLWLTLKTVAPAGWVLMRNGTIGNASSGADIRANADCFDLYVLIWNGISQTYAPVTTSAGGASTRGVDAATDWAANKRIALPWIPGRAIIGAGSGGSLTTRNLGEYFGTEAETLTAAQIPAHSHPNTLSDPGHTHGHNLNSANSSTTTPGGGFSIPSTATGTISSATTGITINNANNTGGGGSHNNMQPSVVLNVMVKL